MNINQNLIEKFVNDHLKELSNLIEDYYVSIHQDHESDFYHFDDFRFKNLNVKNLTKLIDLIQAKKDAQFKQLMNFNEKYLCVSMRFLKDIDVSFYLFNFEKLEEQKVSENFSIHILKKIDKNKTAGIFYKKTLDCQPDDNDCLEWFQIVE